MALSLSAQKNQAFNPKGTWKLSDINLVKAAGDNGPEHKQEYVKESKSVNKIRASIRSLSKMTTRMNQKVLKTLNREPGE
jgi:hypothetical protein